MFGRNRPLEFISRHSAARYDRLIPFIPYVVNGEGYPNLDDEMQEWCVHWSIGNQEFQSEKSVYCLDRFNALKDEVIKRGYPTKYCNAGETMKPKWPLIMATRG